jgi:hypothetical protein
LQRRRLRHVAVSLSSSWRDSIRASSSLSCIGRIIVELDSTRRWQVAWPTEKALGNLVRRAPAAAEFFTNESNAGARSVANDIGRLNMCRSPKVNSNQR